VPINRVCENLKIFHSAIAAMRFARTAITTIAITATATVSSTATTI
jgi:hypothetical protein